MGALPVVTRLTVDLQNVTNVMNAIRKKCYTVQKFANINTVNQKGYMLRGHSHLMSATKGRGWGVGRVTQFQIFSDKGGGGFRLFLIIS